MKCNVKNRMTQEEADVIREKNERTNVAYLNYASRLVYVSLHENAGFGIDRMQVFCDKSYDTTQDYIAFYTADDCPDEEYAVDSYYGMRKYLLGIGFDPEIEFWCDVPFGDGDFPSPSVSAKERERRKMYLHYANTLSFYTREMLCGYAIELHQTNGFGATRLHRVFAEPVKRYLQLMRWYLVQDKQKVLGEMQRSLDAYNALGYFTYQAKIY